MRAGSRVWGISTAVAVKLACRWDLPSGQYAAASQCFAWREVRRRGTARGPDFLLGWGRVRADGFDHCNFLAFVALVLTGGLRGVRSDLFSRDFQLGDALSQGS